MLLLEQHIVTVLVKQNLIQILEDGLMITLYDKFWGNLNLLYFEIETDIPIYDVEYITGYIQLEKQSIEFDIATENLLSDRRLSEYDLKTIAA